MAISKRSAGQFETNRRHWQQAVLGVYIDVALDEGFDPKSMIPVAITHEELNSALGRLGPISRDLIHWIQITYQRQGWKVACAAGGDDTHPRIEFS